MRLPIPDSYWVVPGRLLAGEYPGAPTEEEARRRLALFREAGISSFVDLTEEEEGLAQYSPALWAGARWARFPIRDGGCPTPSELRATLDRVEAELARGEAVYVHCWGGHGRTGVVVGAWLVREGLSGREALARLADLRRQLPEADRRPSPETRAQRELVLGQTAAPGPRL
jgi:hypothetical protein